MAKKSEIIGKSVSFNVLDPDQKSDLEFADQRTNFSAFVKHLIRMERLRQQGGLTVAMVAATDQKQIDDDYVDDSVGGFT